MKLILLVLFVITTANSAEAFWGKKCKAEVYLDTPVHYDITIRQFFSYHQASVTQRINGKVNNYNDTAYVSDHEIKHDLSKIGDDRDRYNLNEGEEQILLAMSLESIPLLDGATSRDRLNASLLKTGINLKSVRHVRIYRIGAEILFGIHVVDAFDKNKKFLGSYLQALGIGKCQ